MAKIILIAMKKANQTKTSIQNYCQAQPAQHLFGDSRAISQFVEKPNEIK